ncbi:MAG: hypothetical protein FJY80_00290 [Candidatus Aminicenantes bacterium]|nr:hypothetical protein [Candidatus Aminicenantes bacterium]
MKTFFDLRYVSIPGTDPRLKQARAVESMTPAVFCFAECNGDLSMASRITTGEDGESVDGGLYRRGDGPKPSWELVYRWTIDKDVLQSRYLRGLTAVPDPRGGGGRVLLAAFEYPGIIVRFEPSRAGANGFIAPEQELDIREFFRKEWDTPAARRRGAIAAYNRFVPVSDPRSGAPLWLCGAWVERPGSPNPPDNGSHYLFRHADATYDWGMVFDPAHPLPVGRSLDATRRILISPFAEDARRVLYFAGYDGPYVDNRSAWIYKATRKERL